jgi:glycosyltransferase involved in cell wall biosynthesis
LISKTASNPVNKMAIRVSVIIPCYNAASWVRQAIESALSQTRPAAEVIVVDDGSTDSSPEVIQRYGVRYIRQDNQGVSVARNTGLEATTADYAIFLDADDCLTPGAIKAFSTACAGDDRVVYGDVVYQDVGTGREREVRKGTFAGPRFHAAKKLFRDGGLPPSAFRVPTQLARRVGGFNPQFSYAADMDFFMRCSCLVPFVHIPNAVLVYRVHENNMSQNARLSILDRAGVRLAFRDWCQNRGIECPVATVSESEVYQAIIQQHYYLRQWPFLDCALAIVRERGISTPQIERIRGLRRVPVWCFMMKDWLDHCISVANVGLGRPGRNS